MKNILAFLCFSFFVSPFLRAEEVVESGNLITYGEPYNVTFIGGGVNATFIFLKQIDGSWYEVKGVPDGGMSKLNINALSMIWKASN